MLVIPLQPLPAQTVACNLSNQACTINVYQKGAYLYLDLLVANALTIGGVICENANPVVRNVYLGFIGDLAFVDTQGTDDPQYVGLGTRYVLVYLLPTEVPGNVS